jgi:hypothetical protein
MAKSRSNFPWSDDQIRKALAPRALPVFDDEDLQVRQALAEEGARHVLARRKGGRKPRDQQVRGEIRRILIMELYRSLKPSLRRRPMGTTTITRVRDLLAEKYGFNVSPDTILKDVKKIGSERLRSG